MPRVRSHRLLTVILSLWALLFAQLSLAAYACPAAAQAAETARMAAAGMPCAQAMSLAMDEEQPALCHAHCQDSKQSADTWQPPVLAAAGELGPVLTIQLPESRAEVRVRPPLRPNASPPLAIAHCCWRI